MRRPGRLPARLAALALAACLGLGGCGGDVAEEPGVVAVVGGEAIRLADVEARHDLSRLGRPEADNPAVERLRAEYGAVVADLIVVRLAAQELARRKLSVTRAEIDAAEAEARADYSDEAFSRLLREERIDLARWREVLADRLTLEKFTREVLRPGVRVDVTEAANYYKEHIDAFAQPARVKLLRVRGGDPEAVKAAQAAARKSGPAGLAGLSGLSVAEADLPEANLPAAWHEAVKGAKAGEATAVLPEGKGGVFFVVLSRRPAAVLEPATAYSRVEAALSARKLEAAFAAWLEAALAEAGVRVSRQLLASAAPPEGGASADNPSADELARAREEAAVREGLAREARKALAHKAQASREGAAPAEDRAATPAATSSAPAERPAAPQSASGTAGSDGPVAVAAEIPPAVSPGESLAPDAESAPAAPEAPAPAPPEATAPAPAAAPGNAAAPPAEAAKKDGGEVVLSAIKASWVLYTVDDGQEQRVYLKPGKPVSVEYAKKLVVRPGSPSEFSYRAGGRETTVVVGKKESRVLEFP